MLSTMSRRLLLRSSGDHLKRSIVLGASASCVACCSRSSGCGAIVSAAASIGEKSGLDGHVGGDSTSLHERRQGRGGSGVCASDRHRPVFPRSSGVGGGMSGRARAYSAPRSCLDATGATVRRGGRRPHHRRHDGTGTGTGSNTGTGSGTGTGTTHEHDRLLVIGSGVAGCATALIAAERHGMRVSLLYAGSRPTDCNSYWAQGGIIYRNPDPASGDSARALRDDVLRAGAGLCDDRAVWKVAMEGPDVVRQLLLDGAPYASVPFDRDEHGSLSLCLEASHSAPRIIHWADHTGKAITEHITAAALRHPLITPIPDCVVVDLALTDHAAAPSSSHGAGGAPLCIGAHVLHRTTLARTTLYASRGVVLASGGLGGIYEHSTNPPGFNALGSSVALASRAGATTRDLEYVQFHPTALCVPNQSRFLLTEALRGEGAILRDASGRPFARDYHADGELAPRDVVARAVFAESRKIGANVALAPASPLATATATATTATTTTPHNTFLDITHRDPSYLRKRFPSIDAYLTKRGYDITKHALPVIPAAHYTCGGVATDSFGRTNVLGLYAAGEAARTGLHGGNRLASTSLLEGLVYGASVANYIGGAGQGQDIGGTVEAVELAREVLNNSKPMLSTSTSTSTTTSFLHSPFDGDVLEWDTTNLNNSGKRRQEQQERIRKSNLIVVDGATMLLRQLKKIMWDDVGLIRTPQRLDHAINALRDIGAEADVLFRRWPCSETAGLRDAARSGLEVAKAARSNRVSAGAHTIVLDDCVGGGKWGQVGQEQQQHQQQQQHHKDEEEMEEELVALSSLSLSSSSSSLPFDKSNKPETKYRESLTMTEDEDEDEQSFGAGFGI